MLSSGLHLDSWVSDKSHPAVGKAPGVGPRREEGCPQGPGLQKSSGCLGGAPRLPLAFHCPRPAACLRVTGDSHAGGASVAPAGQPPTSKRPPPRPHTSPGHPDRLGKPAAGAVKEPDPAPAKFTCTLGTSHTPFPPLLPVPFTQVPFLNNPPLSTKEGQQPLGYFSTLCHLVPAGLALRPSEGPKQGKEIQWQDTTMEKDAPSLMIGPG